MANKTEICFCTSDVSRAYSTYSWNAVNVIQRWLNMGKQVLVYIENKFFIHSKGANEDLPRSVYHTPSASGCMEYMDEISNLEWLRFHMRGNYIQKVVVWFNFREDINGSMVFQCKFLRNVNVNIEIFFEVSNIWKLQDFV